jgi:hypothetical protein
MTVAVAALAAIIVTWTIAQAIARERVTRRQRRAQMALLPTQQEIAEGNDSWPTATPH